MPGWKRYLSEQEIARVHSAAVGCGIASRHDQLDALTSGMEADFASKLPQADLPTEERLSETLTELNRVHNLRNGDVPLAQWLRGAIALADGEPQAETFEAALDKVRHAPTRPPGPAPRTRSGSFGLAPLSATSALAAANLEVVPEAIVAGSDQTVEVAFLSGGLATSTSVVKVLVHRHLDGEGIFQDGDLPWLVNGTGWFIGPDLVITNHHVINARMSFPALEPDADEQDFRLQAENTTLVFDYLDDTKPTQRILTGAGALQASHKGLDFAILRVPPSQAHRRALVLRQRPIRKRPQQALGTRVNLLQHPNGRPMRLGFRDNFVVSGDNDGLSYLTDTDFGSSGSPVCDDRWSVAALHSGSRNVSAEGITIRGRKVNRENYGIPIPRILQFLMTNHPDLHAEILAAQPEPI